MCGVHDRTFGDRSRVDREWTQHVCEASRRGRVNGRIVLNRRIVKWQWNRLGATVLLQLLMHLFVLDKVVGLLAWHTRHMAHFCSIEYTEELKEKNFRISDSHPNTHLVSVLEKFRSECSRDELCLTHQRVNHISDRFAMLCIERCIDLIEQVKRRRIAFL